MTWTRPARYLGTAAVASIAAYASYGHMRAVTLAHGESQTVAALLPLSVDGLLVVAAVAMVDDRRAGRATARWTWTAFMVGVLASLAANVMHAEPSSVARIIAAWPPLALLLTVEMLSRGTTPAPAAEPTQNRAAETVAERTERPTPTKVTGLKALPGGRRGRVPEHVLAKLGELDQLPGRRVTEVAKRYAVTDRTVRRAVARHRQTTGQANRSEVVA